MQESLLHGKEAVMLLNHPYLSEGALIQAPYGSQE
jgi:hypothetical protein